MKKARYAFIAVGLVGSFAAHAEASICSDPVAFGNESDNMFPSGSYASAIPASFFSPSAHQWSEEHDICGQDVYGRWDVDYTLLAIPAPVAGCSSVYAWISFDHSKGDLDMAAYDLAGNTLAISQGVTNSESISLGSSAPKTVIIKVYGYNHATGTYRFYTGCQ
jgi:hypothetical protein